MKAQQSLPDLPRSFKGRYPFRLATTSFIYPDTWVPNVRRLGPYLDEIELLILDKGSENYPSAMEIKALAELSREMDVTYNIHLPMDIDLGHTAALRRQEAVEVVCQLVDLTLPLPVSVHVLHARWTEATPDNAHFQPSHVESWQDRVRDSFEKIIATGIDSKLLAVETLENYPLSWLDPVIFDLDLSVCLDVGHIWLAGLNPADHYQTYREQTRILHLHGIHGQKDHRALTFLNPVQRQIIGQILDDFCGVVSLELFSLTPLTQSFTALEEIYDRRADHHHKIV